MADLQFSNDLLSNVLFCIDSDDLYAMSAAVSSPDVERTNLSCHDHLCGSMHDLANGSSIACAEFFEHDQILTPKIELELQSNLKSVCPVAVLICNAARNLCISL